MTNANVIAQERLKFKQFSLHSPARVHFKTQEHALNNLVQALLHPRISGLQRLCANKQKNNTLCTCRVMKNHFTNTALFIFNIFYLSLSTKYMEYCNNYNMQQKSATMFTFVSKTLLYATIQILCECKRGQSRTPE